MFPCGKRLESTRHGKASILSEYLKDFAAEQQHHIRYQTEVLKVSWLKTNNENINKWMTMAGWEWMGITCITITTLDDRWSRIKKMGDLSPTTGDLSATTGDLSPT